MDITLKIHQGTGKLTGESMCKSCAYATIITDSRNEKVYCNQLIAAMQPRGAVRECTRYYNKTLPTLRDFEMSAWTLRTEKSGRMIGFEAPKHGDGVQPTRTGF